jgi:large subunit ribosomal protein L7/L12
VYGIRPAQSPVAFAEIRPDVVVEEGRAAPAEFDVLLDGFDAPRRVSVIKVVRETTSLGLREARDLVEDSPAVIRERLPRAEADSLKVRLEAAGAKVSIRPRLP